MSEVRGAGLEDASKIGTLKSGSTEFRTASARVLADERDDGVLARRVDRMRRKAPVVQSRDDALRSRGVVVCERAALEERAALGDLGEGRATPPVPTTRIRTDRAFYLTASVVASPPTIRSAEIPGSEVVSVSVTQQKMFVGGEFVDSASGETMEVLNPASGEVIAEVPRGTVEDVEESRRRGGEGVGRVAAQDAQGPHGASSWASRT